MAARSCLPPAAILELTYDCNHRCRFCCCPWEARAGGFRRGRQLSLDEWKSCVRTLVDLGTTRLTFSGGEALLFPGLLELIDFTGSLDGEHVETAGDALVRRHGPPRLFLISNGRALTEGVLQACRRHSVHLSLSLPGLTTFGELTGSDTDPRQVLGWLRRAHELGLRTTANVAVTRRNLPELAQTIDAAFLAGADFLLLNRFLPGGRGLEHASELSLDRRELVQMLVVADAALDRANREGAVGTEIPLCLVRDVSLRRLRVSSRCAAGCDYFVVGPEGRARVCTHSPVQLAPAGEPEALRGDPYWRSYALRELLPDACRGCELELSCDGGCHEAAAITSGSLRSPDPAFSR